jgi:L-rhamnose mutarotase
MRNFSIYPAELKKDEFYLFGYFEYYGDDYDTDTPRMAADLLTLEWWEHTASLQIPFLRARKANGGISQKKCFILIFRV